MKKKWRVAGALATVVVLIGIATVVLMPTGKASSEELALATAREKVESTGLSVRNLYWDGETLVFDVIGPSDASGHVTPAAEPRVDSTYAVFRAAAEAGAKRLGLLRTMDGKEYVERTELNPIASKTYDQSPEASGRVAGWVDEAARKYGVSTEYAMEGALLNVEAQGDLQGLQQFVEALMTEGDAQYGESLLGMVKITASSGGKRVYAGVSDYEMGGILIQANSPDWELF